MRATVVITSKNRRDELRAAISSALTQSVQPEVLVMDDGSTDGTADMVRAEFRAVRLECSEISLGYIVQRNRAARLAGGDIIFSIDDDAAFSTPHVIEQTLTGFDHPRVGAVAIPYLDVNRDKVLRQVAPDRQQIWVTDRYIGTAHAVRRDVFLKLGGYREHFVHQGEEGDFCLRLLNAGYVVRLGNADPIHHFESPKRDFRRMDFYGRRNDILFAWHNVPMPFLLPHLIATTFNGLVAGVKTGRPLRMLRGTLAGYAASARPWRERAPVSAKIYFLHRRLKKDGPARLDEIERHLPPVQPAQHNQTVRAVEHSVFSNSPKQ